MILKGIEIANTACLLPNCLKYSHYIWSRWRWGREVTDRGAGVILPVLAVLSHAVMQVRRTNATQDCTLFFNSSEKTNMRPTFGGYPNQICLDTKFIGPKDLFSEHDGYRYSGRARWSRRFRALRLHVGESNTPFEDVMAVADNGDIV